MPTPSCSPYAYVLTVVRYSHLIWQLTKREFSSRYRGSFLGLLWSFITPLLLLGIYTFVFSMVFQARWGEGRQTSKVEFALILFMGLIVHGIFSECASRAPTTILSQGCYVKRVVFPLEILPTIIVLNAMINAGISFAIMLIFYIIVHHNINITIIYLPVIIIPYLILNLGLVLFLSSCGVFLHDLTPLISLIVTVSMFLCPIFYPISAIPESFRPFIYMNPLTFIIEQSRAVTIFGQAPDWRGLVYYSAGSLMVVSLGLAWFQKTRKGFADVI